jgi:hypothetical protein
MPEIVWCWMITYYICRSRLNIPNYDDDLTERIKANAAQVLDEREAGIFRNRRPADALIYFTEGEEEVE